MPTEPAHSLMYQPATLEAPEPHLAGFDAAGAVGQYAVDPPNARQAQCIGSSVENRLTLLWGPPGTGKTRTLAMGMAARLEHAMAAGRLVNILVGAQNYKALDNILVELRDLLPQRQEPRPAVDIVRLRSSAHPEGPPPGILDAQNSTAGAARLRDDLQARQQSWVVGTTWKQIIKLGRAGNRDPAQPWFDLLIIDEASQVPVAAAAGYFLMLAPDAHVILAGDHRQLGPIYGFELRDSANGLFESIFSYLQETHRCEPIALDQNYRMNEEITAWPRVRFYDETLSAEFPDRRLDLAAELPAERPESWPEMLPWCEHLPFILDPGKPVVLVTYDEPTSTLSNVFEAQLVAALAALYRRVSPAGQTPAFWDDALGIVTPHRAQMAAMRNLLSQSGVLGPDEPAFVDTVDRFQGQERDLILASYVVSDRDFVGLEESFILSARRFNVTLTRARHKFVLVASQAVLTHLPHDAQVAQEAAHSQLFSHEYCNDQVTVDIPYVEGGDVKQMRCAIRWRGGG